MNSIPLMSRDIVDSFVRSGDKYRIVDTEKTGRSSISVYNSLLGYTKRHDYLHVSVRMVKGDIVLVNDEKHREDQAVC
jgi:hypothetical protein